MTEVELKAALTGEQRERLPGRLAELGFAAQDAERETDVYWNGADRDFRKTDEALRLRTVQDLRSGAASSLITYKGPKQDGRSSTRLEHETTVGDMDTARQLLAALGYQALFTVEKTRRTFVRGHIAVCLDDVRGLGGYLELETLLEREEERERAVDDLLSLLDTLGVAREALTRESYLELLIASAMEKKSS